MARVLGPGIPHHLTQRDDRLTKVAPLLSIFPERQELLSLSTDEEL
jgi:hypothetical protein